MKIENVGVKLNLMPWLQCKILHYFRAFPTLTFLCFDSMFTQTPKLHFGNIHISIQIQIKPPEKISFSRQLCFNKKILSALF